ncbi:FAST kinase domain-containing protein 1, mitochondrial [Hippoglossus hippoglossus]|uniref:FAST kinase domain-containing protein 1, mitochondrial n=1 Tax=Hippoglossus hippoglossus TaxID=8267 RepID=UPI00148C5988|nr:FAST kinase domain-containing protein 1, mitochondrial [Hippoglossus hippoglossus]XP_034429764.1 FAST kinase domain-containing protein 1, mitochondrial [Hippoglossus hippoglossus]XP_034429765.1 FAST kinase domain-containing protein 1, mitochondrial [Hippoglossus hippoglossus]XP_034429766.1 FAST kinase domain-containing protein 1, mitochondrial [Hippoglossus hippoglossus]
MFRLRRVTSCLRRLLHGGTGNRDQVLEQLRVCSAEDQVLDMVGKNKAKLTVSHVSCAVGMLWQFQREKPQLLRTVELIRTHPQFLTLRVLAENKIALMDDFILVDMLYNFLRLNVDPHDSLIQQLVSEAWLRIDRFQMGSLSKFAICLSDQHLQHSPLMGHITSIVDQRLSSIDDARILTTLMISTSSLVSTRLRDAFVSKADELLDTMDPSNYNNPRRVVQFLRNMKYSHRPLLEKCNQILLSSIPRLDAENISIIMGLYQALQFNNCDFRLAVKQRLVELIDSSTDPFSFSKLFVALTPMASLEIREGLENTAFLLADELSAQQALAVAEALEEIQSRNLSLLNKIASVVQRNLHVYKPVEVARITQALYLLQYQNPEFFTKLRRILVNFLLNSVFPHEVTMLTRVLSMLPSPRLEEAVKSRVEAVVTQCSLNDLNTISFAVAKWVRNDPSYRHGTPSKYVRLLQTLNRCGHERLQTTDRLDLLLEELKYVSGEWFEEMLLQETMVTLQRMMDQMNWTSVPELAFFLTRMNHLCPPLMDRIASVAIKEIDKIHYSATYATLLPFSVLSYDPPQADELYDVCIQRFTPHISSFDPHLLVLLAYSLAVADSFPEELIREIFSIDFLGKLDSQLETLPDSLNMRTRLRLMELNRAVCLECPEFQVPWFHESHCQQLQRKGNGSVSPVQQQIHKMLGEVLGGINCVQVAVVTPYFYTIDFECVLDKHLQPLPYTNLNTLQISDRGKAHWGVRSLENDKHELPPGAQRVAVNFLDSRCFCKNSHHMKGEALMRKRHLEILGYRVVQIPHFEWNSMELSTQDAWKEYLKKKIFRELSL